MIVSVYFTANPNYVRQPGSTYPLDLPDAPDPFFIPGPYRKTGNRCVSEGGSRFYKANEPGVVRWEEVAKFEQYLADDPRVCIIDHPQGWGQYRRSDEAMKIFHQVGSRLRAASGMDVIQYGTGDRCQPALSSSEAIDNPKLPYNWTESEWDAEYLYVRAVGQVKRGGVWSMNEFRKMVTIAMRQHYRKGLVIWFDPENWNERMCAETMGVLAGPTLTAMVPWKGGE